jgi:hypothetical protein
MKRSKKSYFCTFLIMFVVAVSPWVDFTKQFCQAGDSAQRLAKNLPFNFTNILPRSAQLNSPHL